ncbi:hypothetical protein Indivirus_2_14 [Indivirus ILV1]|uniref:Uncharacterized protein n=1 Tax=Indivirus ILV1 TaxID=1977633 RepID=A0A1V0SD42_9VIRU|nr:hypothetical protein Indivirus_2_14 [Indivirus ILV1]
MDLNIKEQKLVSGQDISKQPGSIVYDFGGDENKSKTLPNATLILDKVIEILECMNTDEMKELRSQNQNLFESKMEEKFEDFAYQYYGIFRILLSGQDISPLFMMLGEINKCNTGNQSYDDTEKSVGNFLNKFIPQELMDKLKSGEINLDKPNKPNKKKKKRHIKNI